MKTIIVSACLLGIPCRYDGKSKPISDELFNKICEDAVVIPFCPEVAGGLPTPREPCEIISGRAVNRNGDDCSAEFNKGAELLSELVKSKGADLCILKSNSPSCGKHKIYDGSFSGTLIDGSGIAAKLLKNNGFVVFDETELDEVYSIIKN